jgi:aspartate 1-decarboxylase
MKSDGFKLAAGEKMQITVLKSKIHRATITGADLNYEGSISIDKKLLEAANILPYELVHVVNINSGARFETYAIEAKAGSGTIALNGAAARLGQPGDLVIIISYCLLPREEAIGIKPVVVKVDSQNKQI